MINNRYNEFFRINMAEYYLINEDGMYKKTTARPNLLFDDSSLVIVSAIDRKVYNLTGKKAPEPKKEAAENLTKTIAARRGFEVEEIIYPSEKVEPEHIQFIEYFIDDLYLPRIKTMDSLKYTCYFCSEPIERNNEKCLACGKEINFCFICNLPISFGENIGKCSLCGALAHLTHFQEWIKTLGMCTQCDKKLHHDGIIPITDKNKDQFFKK